MTTLRPHRLRAGVLCGASLLALLAAAPARAQTAPAPARPVAPADAAVEEVVVTAQRREETLSSVPIAIQAIRGDTLERKGITQLTTLVNDIPSASVVTSHAPGFETIQIRGVSSGATGDSTVGYYVDDVAFSVPNLQLTPPSKLFDLERVEVLRGPQGTLYGAGAEGGLIRIITAAPDLNRYQVKGRVEFSGTEDGGFNDNYDGVVNIPIVQDKVALRISGGYERLSGYARSADNPAQDDVNDLASYNVRVKLRVKPTEHIDATFSYWRINNDMNYSYDLLSVNPPTAQAALGTQPFTRTTADIYTALVNWDLGFASLQSSTSYTEHELALDTTVYATSIPPLGPISSRAVDDFRTHAFSQEVRLVSSGPGPFKWQLGGIYTDAKITSNFIVNLVPQALPSFVIPYTQTVGTPLFTESFAIYGEASYDLFDGRLKPLVGLRYYRDDRRAEDHTSISGGPFIASNGGQVFDAVSPRFNLTWKASRDGIVYANIAKGFRSGTLQTATQVFLAAQSGVTTSSVIDPDELWSYELGTKWKLRDTGVSFELAGYYTDWSHIQIPFSTTSGLPSVVNGADADIYGMDATVTWRATPELTLQALGGINSSSFRNVSPALSAALATAQDGKQLPGVPRANATVSAAYVHPLTADVTLDLSAAYSYRGRQSDLGTGLVSSDLNLVSLRAGIDYRTWKLDVFADNLTDDRGPAAVSSLGQQSVYPRRIGVAASFKY